MEFVVKKNAFVSHSFLSQKKEKPAIKTKNLQAVTFYISSNTEKR